MAFLLQIILQETTIRLVQFLIELMVFKMVQMLGYQELKLELFLTAF